MLAYMTLCGVLLGGSFFIAALCGGFAPGTWAWGAFGPAGWAIALFLGIGHRARTRRAWARRRTFSVRKRLARARRAAMRDGRLYAQPGYGRCEPITTVHFEN